MSYANGPRIVTDGLVCCLDAANRKCIQPTSDTAIDLTGNGFNPVFRNSSGTQTNLGSMETNLRYDTSDAPAACLNFVGYGNNTQGYMEWNNHPLGGHYQYTIDAWFKITRENPITNYNVIFYSSHGTNQSFQSLGFMAQNTTSDKDVALELNNAYTGGSSNYRLTLGWHHCVLTYAGSSALVYVDNDLKYTKGGLTSNYTIPTSNWNWIGVGQWANGSYNGAYGYTEGKLGAISFYSKQLSSNEVKQNYNALKGRFGL